MKKRVAIIDTGIDLSTKKFIIGKDEGISLSLENGRIIEHKNIQDDQGHGTMCASVITSIVESVEIVPIKIFSDLRLSSSLLLIEALKKCLDMNIDLINISLATLECDYYKEIYEAARLLKQQNKIIVSALHNTGKNSIPAVLDNVIGIAGIGVQGEFSRFLFNKENIIQGFFDNTPQFALNHKGKYRLFSGNSKATAVASGVILQCMMENDLKTFEGVSNYLHEKSKEIKLKQIPFEEHDLSNNIFNNNIVNKVSQFIKEVTGNDVDREVILNGPIMQKKIGLNYDNIIDLLNKIFDYYNISMDVSKITANQICSISGLVRLIRMEGKLEKNF